MTFRKDQIENMTLDMGDEWQIDEDDKSVSCAFYGLDEAALGFFGADLEEQYPDGWLDRYAVLDPRAEICYELLFVLKTNDNGEDDNRELKISFTNQPEQKAIYAQLAKSGGEVFREFVRDYLKETSPKKPCEVKGCDGTYNCPFSDNPTSDFCRNQCGEGVDE